MVRSLVFICAFFLFSAEAGAVTRDYVIGQITLLRIFANGPAGYDVTDEAHLLVYVAGIPLACGSGPTRVGIGSNHPMYESILSTAMTAYTAGRDVRLTWNEECTLRAPNSAWDMHGLDMNP